MDSGRIPGINPKDVHHLTVVARERWSAVTLRMAMRALSSSITVMLSTRQNNSLAHEIGHIVLRHEPAKMYFTPDGLMMMSEYNPIHEEEANWFAGAILVPRDAYSMLQHVVLRIASPPIILASATRLSNEAKSYGRRHSAFTSTWYVGSLSLRERPRSLSHKLRYPLPSRACIRSGYPSTRL